MNKVVQAQQHKKFWDLVCKLKDGKFEIPGLNIEKLHTRAGKLFSARMTREMRLIFSMRHEPAGNSLIIHELNHHDDAYDRVARQEHIHSELEDAASLLAPLGSDGQSAQLTDELRANMEDGSSSPLQGQLFKVPYYLLSDPDKYIQFERSLDRYLILSDEQEEILKLREKAMLVQGPAGTGKTTLALFSALNLFEENIDDAIYLFTYHEELACVCRAYKVNLVGVDEIESESDVGIKVFSYIDFCRRHLRRSLKKNDRVRKWMDKRQSLEMLRMILGQKSRWRNFQCEDLYGLFYSILKGRFMPGTENLPASREDYERIFKDYGRMPDDLEEILEIFSQYQMRLEKNNALDEADIIRLSYETLKKKALLAEVPRLWIVIDEVQDFTELEWKSILLFWENHCKRHRGTPSFPFLSGDINQNISRSGFRWQELETYLQTILKNLHRPNALKKVALHQNYRNTKQIHQLATFIRKFGSDMSDLGLAPELEGDRPRLVVTSDQEFLIFLKERSLERGSDNPLVVLVENEDSLHYLRRELADSQSVFLLSLPNSKGMEFEDVIIHRAFSSCQRSTAQGVELSRCFDLWYMGMTRARKNLLLVQNPEDRKALQDLLQDRFSDFGELVETLSAARGFSEFWINREAEMPNYNVIFLERKLAQDLWQEFLNFQEKNPAAHQQTSESQSSSSDNKTDSIYATQCKERALNLWRRCLDYSSLGKALMYLENFEEACGFLKRSGHFKEAAECLEACQKYHEAAGEYEKLTLNDEAARCYEYAQEYSQAGKLYEHENNWLLAAQNYHNAGDLTKAAHACEKAGMLRSAADIYRTKGKYQRAAELYFKCDDFLNAGDMYLRIKDKLDAARCFQRAGKFAKAVELYESLNRYAEAGEAARQGRLFSKAGTLFLKAGKLKDSASSFEAAYLPENAANLYMRINDFDKAAECYEQAGKIAKAAFMYERAGRWQKAMQIAETTGDRLMLARCHEKLADFTKAAAIFLENGLNLEAAGCFEKASDYLQAADLYLKGQNLTQAAQCLAKANRRMDAAKLYVITGQVATAFDLATSSAQSSRLKGEDDLKQLLDWCMEAKRIKAAAQLLELKKDYQSASDRYRECLMLPKAAECLEKFGRHSDAANLYKEAGDLEKAARCFRQAKLFQEAGGCFERLQNWSEAKKMYERSNDRDGVVRCDNAMNWL